MHRLDALHWVPAQRSAICVPLCNTHLRLSHNNGNFGTGGLGLPSHVLARHILAKSNSSSRVFEKNTPLWEAWSSLFCLCLPLFFPDLFSPPSGKPKEGGTALLRGALPSQASTPPAKACASEKAVLHHTPATTGHCWAPSLLTRISSELTAL